MSRYGPLWQQAGNYTASVDRGLLGALWPNGGVLGGVVTAVSNTMNVQAAAGTVAVPLQSGQGSALCRWDNPASDATVDVTKGGAAPVPPSGQSRIDLIVVQVRDNALDSGGNNDFIVTSVTGTAATTGSQVAPAVPTNALVLAQVLIAGASANLNAAPITDLRPFGLGPVQPMWSVYRAAAYTDVNATGTACPFDTMLYDNAGWGALGANAGYTVRRSGLYQVAGAWTRSTGLAAGHAMTVHVRQNNNNVMQGNYCQWTASGFNLTGGVGGLLRCAAGDLLQLFYLDFGGGACNANQAMSWMTVAKIGE